MALHRYGDFRVEVFYFDSPCRGVWTHRYVVLRHSDYDYQQLHKFRCDLRSICLLYRPCCDRSLRRREVAVRLAAVDQQ